MPARVWRRPAAVRSSKSLVVRAGPVRTFGGLASFLVVTFLCAGIYILEDAVAHPLAAQAAALLFYLIRPGSGPPRLRREQAHRDKLLPQQEFLEEAPVTAHQNNDHEDPVYQRVYKDHSRIRL